MRWLLVIGWTILAASFGATPATADKRVALVIGNAAYRQMPRLTNPVNDAEDVGKSLRDLGFETIVATDLDRAGMNTTLGRFVRMVDGADIAIVYYAGHGMQFSGSNYLLPIDARLESAADANRFQLMPIDDLLEALRLARGARMLVLDACRNNPAEEDLKRRLASVPGANRDALSTRGLNRVSAGSGLLIAYATQANDVANDGTGRNSPFTAAFLKHVATPDVDLRQMLFNVQDEVHRATQSRQRPELSISLVGQFKLKVAAVSPAGSPGAAGQRAGEAERAWATTKDSTSISLLEEFARRYADSFYATHARVRIEQLKNQQVAVVAPSVSPVAPPGAGTTPAVGVYPPKPAPDGAPNTFKDCDACPEMVMVPPGHFMLGSREDETERSSSEGPQRQVRIPRLFAVGRFAVTFDEWDACVADGGCLGYMPSDYGWGRGRLPVINVSRNDINTYMVWLERKTGKKYRLLSEAEREYVTRAGTTTPYWFGFSISTGQANYDGNLHTYSDGPKGESRGRTVPVDWFFPNPFGLYQMHGNVREWVEDCWSDSYRSAPIDGSAWIAGDCSRRVLRGGSWKDGPRALRSADRRESPAVSRRHDVGFRVARSLAP
jgi:formylglycine-generating enzyme required for sulfatase activity